jgi:hypothetical protein
MFSLAALLGALAVRPNAAAKPIVLLLSLIPLFVVILIYIFLAVSLRRTFCWPPPYSFLSPVCDSPKPPSQQIAPAKNHRPRQPRLPFRKMQAHRQKP